MIITSDSPESFTSQQVEAYLKNLADEKGQEYALALEAANNLKGLLYMAKDLFPETGDKYKLLEVMACSFAALVKLAIGQQSTQAEFTFHMATLEKILRTGIAADEAPAFNA